MELPFFELPAGRFTFVVDEGNKPRIKCLEGDERAVPKLEALFDALDNAETKEECIAITKKIMNVGGVDDKLEPRRDTKGNEPVLIH